MAFLEIPTRTDVIAYEYFLILDGATYNLSFSWNDRMGKWIFDIADQEKTPLVTGVPIIASWPILERFKNPKLPPGTLFALDTSGKDLDPGRTDLGSRVLLIYREADT